MLKEERQHIILEKIQANNKVHSSTLSEILNVSEDTIRRDLKDLAEQGYIKKVHGGAMANPNLPKAKIDHNISNQTERKIIARKAASIIEDHQVIVLDGDLTNLMLVESLPKDLNLTVFTNSLRIASLLCEYEMVETIFLGGRVSRQTQSTMGMEVINSLSEIHADFSFLEINSLHEELGITDGDRENAFIKKSIIKSSSQVIALCLSDDIGNIQPFKVGQINWVHSLITDLDPEDPKLNRFRNKGIDLR